MTLDPPDAAAAPLDDSWPAGSLRPQPGASPLSRMLLAQTALELKLTLRKGESVLLTLVIPVLLLLLFARVSLVDLPGDRPIDYLVPGVMALAVMSSSFTGLAIATGYDRQYGVLKRLGATALTRPVLLAGKTGAVLAVMVLQLLVLAGLGLLLGWEPTGNPLSVLVLVALATAAFAGLALALAGRLRAEATLALANLIYLVLLGISGMVFPLTAFPAGLASAVRLLPSAALAHGMRAVLESGTALPLRDAVTLLVWAVGGLGLATRVFRWE